MSQTSALITRFAAAALIWIAVPQGCPAQQNQYSKEIVDQLHAGRSLMEAEKYSEARELFNKLVAEKPDCADAYNGIGVTYMRQGSYKSAETALMKAAELDPLNVIVLNNLGLSMSFQRKFKQSIIYYKQALKIVNDNDAEIQTNLANSLAETDQLKEAKLHYQAALKLKPDNASAYKGLAEMSYNHKQYKAAVDYAQKAVNVKPDYSTAYYTLGVSQSALHNFAAAETAFKQSLKYEKNPAYAKETQQLIDSVHSAMSEASPNQPPSVASETKATDVTDGKAVGSDDQASAQKAVYEINDLMKQHRWKQAEQKINAQLVTGKGNAILYNNLGLALVHLNEDNDDKVYIQACTAYRKAIELKHGPFATAQYNLGQALRLLNRPDEAESAFKQSILDARADHQTCPLSQLALGVMLKQKGDLDGADRAYRSALLQSGNELPVIHYNLGLLLEKRGDKMREAAREYKRYLALAPNGVNAKQAKSRLKRLGM